MQVRPVPSSPTTLTCRSASLPGDMGEILGGSDDCIGANPAPLSTTRHLPFTLLFQSRGHYLCQAYCLPPGRL